MRKSNLFGGGIVRRALGGRPQAESRHQTRNPVMFVVFGKHPDDGTWRASHLGTGRGAGGVHSHQPLALVHVLFGNLAEAWPRAAAA